MFFDQFKNSFLKQIETTMFRKEQKYLFTDYRNILHTIFVEKSRIFNEF